MYGSIPLFSYGAVLKVEETQSGSQTQKTMISRQAGSRVALLEAKADVTHYYIGGLAPSHHTF